MRKSLITAYAAEKMLSAAYTVIKTGINEKGNYYDEIPQNQGN